jgi:Chalcone isomerase-like
MLRGLTFLAFVLCGLSAQAADLDGVAMPDQRVVNGTPLHLNGIGLRTFPLFGIHIYVAGLYLEQPSADPETIIRSRGTKLLDIRFVRDVDAKDAQDAWRESFDDNCVAPCYLDPRDVRQFLAEVPSVRKGDSAAFLFTQRGLQVTFNGRLMGDITDQHFADVLLTTFIGPVPPTPRLKRELLGLRD